MFDLGKHMINKTIHYCWFGGEIPDAVRNRVKQWQSMLTDYKFVLWNEKNFDVHALPFTEYMYEQHNYAYVTDYVRLYAVYNYGGFYFDTDVILLKSIDDLRKNTAVFALEDFDSINTGLGLAAEANIKVLKDLLQIYEEWTPNENVNKFPTCVEIASNYFRSLGFRNVDRTQYVNDCLILSTEYFAPMKVGSKYAQITPNTYGIHQYAASWTSQSLLKLRLKRAIRTVIVKLFGSTSYQRLRNGVRR
ncbi:glycosyltransferase family 32 protein [Lactiplantibacillus paraplantarum]|uniref:glycosyltransferase family 32 protein n=1 Tax=Lactiplantibacillus paraplantarum TaxID=60520 RepID=UPI0005341908|nr:glycosyltransferase [Lactiplantibacillus paraplantarum]MCU4683191.1 glycosyltransferase [Lactiplantibacillus paraplantarum]MDL2062191.1 TcdA/TcdB catalytic glycosyltransferase domain-containing protein [Lactiplantibacillus paraplantarum]